MLPAARRPVSTGSGSLVKGILRVLRGGNGEGMNIGSLASASLESCSDSAFRSSTGHHAIRDVTSSAKSKYRLSEKSWGCVRFSGPSKDFDFSALEASGSANPFSSSAMHLVTCFMALVVLRTRISRKS